MIEGRKKGRKQEKMQKRKKEKKELQERKTERKKINFRKERKKEIVSAIVSGMVSRCVLTWCICCTGRRRAPGWSPRRRCAPCGSSPSPSESIGAPARPRSPPPRCPSSSERALARPGLNSRQRDPTWPTLSTSTSAAGTHTHTHHLNMLVSALHKYYTFIHIHTSWYDIPVTSRTPTRTDSGP